MRNLMAEIDTIGRDIEQLAMDVPSMATRHETAAVDDLAYDFSELLGELETIRTSPVPSAEKEEKIRKKIRKLKEAVEGTRRSARIAARALTRNVNMRTAAANTSYNSNPVRSRANKSSRYGNNNRRSRANELSRGAYGNNRRSTSMRNNRTRNNRSSSNAPKRPAKSIYAKASDIIAKKNNPIVPAPRKNIRDIQLSGYMGRIQELNSHIAMNRGNPQLKEARNILQAKVNAAFPSVATDVNMSSSSATAAAVPVGIPMSEKLTGAAKDKSVFEQAKFIVNNRAKIQSSTKSFEITYYNKQYDALVDFIRHYPGNTHRTIIEEAISILGSNPAVGKSYNVMANNNNL